MARCRGPLTPRPLSPKGGEGRVELTALAPWGRGWLEEAFSSAEARRGPHALLVVGVRGFRLLPNLMWDTTLGYVNGANGGSGDQVENGMLQDHPHTFPDEAALQHHGAGVPD